jgi:hypothetical protein
MQNTVQIQNRARNSQYYRTIKILWFVLQVCYGTMTSWFVFRWSKMQQDGKSFLITSRDLITEISLWLRLYSMLAGRRVWCGQIRIWGHYAYFQCRLTCFPSHASARRLALRGSEQACRLAALAHDQYALLITTCRHVGKQEKRNPYCLLSWLPR